VLSSLAHTHCLSLLVTACQGGDVLNMISSAFATMRQRVEKASGSEAALLELGVVPASKVQTDG